MERVSHAVAAELRATLGRKGMSASALADRIGKNSRWMSARIGTTANVDMTIDEIAEMAEALGVDAERLVLDALRACRDSNPKPSDLVFGSVAPVKDTLTADRRNRSGWVLAA